MALPTDVRRRRLVAGGLVVLVCAMVGVAYAAVPLYRAFCAATGFDGTARRAEKAIFTPIDRKLTVRFDTNVRGLPWDFEPEQATSTVQIGKAGLAYFRVKNRSDHAIRARAAYNVSPEAAAAYFIKTQCFCFNDQTIAAGQEVSFPVIYYVDPKFAKDSSTSALTEIVLSYTFYPVPESAPASPAARS